MTKEHFEETARIIKWQLDAAKTEDERWMLRNVATDLAVMFAGANSRFDRDRFMTACGF